MKKKLITIIASLTLITGVLAGCSSSATKSSDTLKIGADPTPHSEILEYIKPALEKEGVKLEIVNLDTDLNVALQDKEIDANYFQHVPYLDAVSKEKGFKFTVAGAIHVEPIGLYSSKIKSINDLKDGDTIAISSSPSNEYRGLALLETNGIIKLKSGIVDYKATPSDIAENPKHLKFIEVDPAQLPRTLPDVAAAVINTNYVLEAKIDPNTALIREDAKSPYANIVVVREEDKDKESIKKLIKVLQTDDVKKFIKEKYGVAVVPAF